MKKICAAKSIPQDDRSVGFIPAIPFSEFPTGEYCIQDDMDNPGTPAYYLVDPDMRITEFGLWVPVTKVPVTKTSEIK
jgi:hypothetical protein